MQSAPTDMPKCDQKAFTELPSFKRLKALLMNERWWKSNLKGELALAIGACTPLRGVAVDALTRTLISL